MAQKQAVPVAEDTAADQAIIASTIAPAPEFQMTDDIKSMIGNEVANGLALALPAVMAELLKTVSGNTPNYGNIPSPVTNVSFAPQSVVKQTFLKHYRLDDTVSGKYQMIDVQKLRAGAKIGDAAIKGHWIHFASDNYYAETQQEVDFIDWLVETYGLPIYEDVGSSVSMLRCAVEGCGRIFGDEETLRNHLRATHGVDSANA